MEQNGTMWLDKIYVHKYSWKKNASNVCSNQIKIKETTKKEKKKSIAL